MFFWLIIFLKVMQKSLLQKQLIQKTAMHIGNHFRYFRNFILLLFVRYTGWSKVTQLVNSNTNTYTNAIVYNIAKPQSSIATQQKIVAFCFK